MRPVAQAHRLRGRRSSRAESRRRARSQGTTIRFVSGPSEPTRHRRGTWGTARAVCPWRCRTRRPSRRATSAGPGRSLEVRPSSRSRERLLQVADGALAERRDDFRTLEQPPALLCSRAVADVRVPEDLLDGAAACVLAEDVLREVLLASPAREERCERIAEPGHATRTPRG